jgi:hypothetical protein
MEDSELISDYDKIVSEFDENTTKRKPDDGLVRLSKDANGFVASW